MSRIGKKHIVLPAGVSLSYNDGLVTVKGPKGELSHNIGNVIGCQVEGNVVTMICPENADSSVQAKHGLYRAIVHNMVVGVHDGFTRNLIINGVGYKAAVQGNKLVLNIGYSHPIEMEAPAGIKFECPTQTEIVVSGCDKTPRRTLPRLRRPLQGRSRTA